MKFRLIMAVTTMFGLVVCFADQAEAKPADAGKSDAKPAVPKQTKKTKGKMSLADARSRIDKAIESRKVMGEIMKKLSAEDQIQFLADVNKAIGDMPGSLEEKTALYLNANHVAIVEAAAGNIPALTAEVFATVPPEALTVINERFAIDLFNRSSNPKVTCTDAQFTSIALALIEKVNERVADADNASARSAFAMLMLIRASNGSPADLADKLIDTLEHDDVKELAKSEWIPAALGKDGREQGYEPLLASADAGRRPDLDFVLVIAGPQFLESILEDIVGKNTDQMAFMRTRAPVLDAVENKLIHMFPTLGGDLPGAAGETGGNNNPPPDPIPPDPPPYPGQSTLGSSN